MERETAFASVSHAIQLSVAPVFLLSGVGAMLAVLTNRLARVVDRARTVETMVAGMTGPQMTRHHDDLAAMSRRAKLINRAVTFCTLTALFVCGVIVTLFVGAFLHLDTSVAIATLFIAAMTSFIVALLFFLREIFVATASLRIGPH